MNPRLMYVPLLIALLLAACRTAEEFPVVGTLERDRIVLSAEAREPIVALHVREGQRVAAGELLLELDTGRAQAELEQLDAVRERLARRLDELLRGPRREAMDEARARLRAAASTLVAAGQERERVHSLHSRGLVSDRELDQATATHDRAAGERDTARAALEAMLEGTTLEELDQARAALAEAEAAHRRQALTQARLAVHSPRDAVVEALPFETGETPAPGAALAVLRASDRPPYARVYVPAALRAGFQPGSRVQVRLDHHGEFAGTVRFIAGEAAYTPYFALTGQDMDRLSYLAEIDIVDGEALPSGVPVRAVALEPRP